MHVLRTGCRAVESNFNNKKNGKRIFVETSFYSTLVDCYDGEDMEPIVYHGHTLTAPIQFREIVQAIQTVAFEASP